MIDFLNFNDEITDEMLAAYIDGNATETENLLIGNSTASDDLLSEVIDIVADINSYGNKNNEWETVDTDDNLLLYDYEYPFCSHPDELMTASTVQDPLELNIEIPPIDMSGDIDIGEDNMDEMLNL